MDTARFYRNNVPDTLTPIWLNYEKYIGYAKPVRNIYFHTDRPPLYLIIYL